MKKLVLRSLFGAPLGLTIGIMIATIISACIGDGKYHLVGQQLIDIYGNEFNAVTVQLGFCALYGAMWAGASVIWEKENWSLLRQTVTHLLITSLSTLPIAWFTGWMEHSLAGVLGYYGMFLATYFAIWLSQYLSIKKRVAQINEKLKNAESE